MSRPARVKGKGRRGATGTVDSQIVASHHAAARGDYNFDAADLTAKRMSWNLVQSPPKNFLTMPHWIQNTWDTSLTVSGVGSVVENAQGFLLSTFPAASSIAALFDQYCIYSVMSRAFLDLSSVTTGIATYGILASALDFDSSGTVGSLAAIERFGSCQISELVPGKSYERFVKPTVAGVTGSSNSTSSTGVDIERRWINSNSPNVPHFGIRYLTNGNQSLQAPTLRLFFTAVIGMRNNI